MTPPAPAADGAPLPLRHAVSLFAVFASAYFLSALVRAVTATLAPVFSAELGLAAGQLGLLAGAYFLGFSVMQLPLGSALDRHGPRRVQVVLLIVAVFGCLAFAAAQGFVQLLLARFLVGVGVSACLMAPLTSYRRLFTPAAQLRANSWMLMTGSMGMLAATLPVQWLLPLLGWRGLFVVVGAALFVAALAIRWQVPAGAVAAPHPGEASSTSGYRAVFAHPAFRRLAPAGFVVYGGMIAMQTLWIGPWLTQVAGRSAAEAASGLFVVNLTMLFAFLAWGLAMPRLIRRGWAGDWLIARAWPVGVAVLLWIVWLGPQAGAAHWALWCATTSVVTLSQPAVGQAFPATLAGRALSAFNLMIFAGVFSLQWGLGLAIDALLAAGVDRLAAYRHAFTGMAVACTLAYVWLMLSLRGDRVPRAGAVAGR